MDFNSILTLTYGSWYPRDGVELKKHLNNLLTFLRRKYSSQYIWIVEFQKRGAPHFHILLDTIPTALNRFEVAEFWSNGIALNWRVPATDNENIIRRVNLRNKMFVVHFHQKTWETIRVKEGAARYISQYVTKAGQKEVPRQFENVGRFWGASQEVKLPDPKIEFDVDEQGAREWLKMVIGRDLDHFDVLPKVVYLYNEKEDVD